MTASDGSPQVSVISPTYNESGNVAELVARVGDVLAPYRYEIIIVDDNSPDRTWERVEEISARDSRVRIIRRRGVRGLSGAVLEGMAAAKADVMIVMDADLQHDEQILSTMVEQVLGGSDLCVGSRRATGGGYGDWSRGRRIVSNAAAFLARRMTGVSTSDPMSGFFAVSRAHYDSCRPVVDARGFKILLEFTCRRRPKTPTEIGYVFRSRHWGETKLSGRVILDFISQLRSLRGWTEPPPVGTVIDLRTRRGGASNDPTIGFRRNDLPPPT